MQYQVLSACPLLMDVGTHLHLAPIGPWKTGAFYFSSSIHLVLFLL
jgi:hypothetical protein